MSRTPRNEPLGDSGRSSITPLVAAVVVVVVLALVFPALMGRRGGDSIAPGAPEAGAARSASVERVDPTPYRALIVELESVLYRSSPGDFADADRVSAQAMQLALGVRGDGRDPVRQRAYEALFDFAGAVEARAEVGYTTADLPDLRGRWEAARERAFAPAGWFRGSSPALTAAQTPAQPVANAIVVRQLNDFADELEELIRSGRREALAIPEAGVDAALESAEARQAEQQWRDWSRRFLTRLDGVLRSFPGGPGQNAPPDMVMAYQELSRATNVLRMVPQTAAGTTSIPFVSERESRFATASGHVANARRYLGRVG